MSKLYKFSVLASVTALALASAVAVADAKPRKKVKPKPPAPARCLSMVQGAATSTGILGTGTLKAQAEARANWQINAASAHGQRYANFNNARAVRWDCKKGAILLAKCVVTAHPCRF